MFVIDPTDLSGAGNGDVCIRTDKGTLVALVYAEKPLAPATARAEVVVAALNAAFAPSHTDLTISPEGLDDFMARNPLPHPDQTSPMTVGPEHFLEEPPAAEVERLRRELTVEREITANLVWAVEHPLNAAVNDAFIAAAEQMITHEDGGGDGWWKGFEMLKAAYAAKTA